MNKYTKKDFDLIRFPNGEFKITTKMNITGNFELKWLEDAYFGNDEKTKNPSEELVALLQLNELVGILQIQAPFLTETPKEKHENKPTVYIDYVPFRRQDKRKLLEEVPFNTWTNNLTEIKLIEAIPHDNLSKEQAVKNMELFLKYIPKETTMLCLPDYGAIKRFDTSNFWGEVIVIDKKRDAQTGKIEFKFDKYKMKNKSFKNEIVTIIDDIIAYGGTFSAVQDYLRECGAKKVHLIVNHSDGVATQNTLDLFDSVKFLNGGLDE